MTEQKRALSTCRAVECASREAAVGKVVLAGQEHTTSARLEKFQKKNFL
jgi:hypothetical protein